MSSVCQRKGRQYQSEMAERFHLPFAVLSDEKLSLTCALGLPTMAPRGTCREERFRPSIWLRPTTRR
jgi:peroxiredoxin